MDKHLDERWISDLPRAVAGIDPTPPMPGVPPEPVIVPTPELPNDEPSRPSPEPMQPVFPGVIPGTPHHDPVPWNPAQPIHEPVPIEIPGPMPQPIHEPVT